MRSAISIKGLNVETHAGLGLVRNVSLNINEGEVLALVGESGSGKTTTGLAMLGHARAGLRITAGEYTIGGSTPVVTNNPDVVAARRGVELSYVPQDPATALNPSMRVQDQIKVMLATHQPARNTTERVCEMLRQVQLPDDARFRSRFPHQLSGGQQQRVAIAMGLVCNPTFAVFDEPTTGLDVITQKRLLDQIETLRSATNLGLLYVTHDLGVVAEIADRVAVMYRGEIVEEGSAQEVLRSPQHPYTVALRAVTPDHAQPISLNREKARSATAAPPNSNEPALELARVSAGYRTRGGHITVAKDISFAIHPGECLALVGQSGSGKSTLSRVIAGLHAPSEGEVRLHGEPLPAKSRARTRSQRRAVQMIFQNPRESLNPRHTVVDSVARSAHVLRSLSPADARAEAVRLFDLVRLPQSLRNRFPEELSGGQLQRIAIARALAAEPSLLVCDEVTSALDVSVQATVLELIDELRTELGLSLLFVTHDLGVVSAVAQRVIVLDRGSIVEEGPTRTVLRKPQHGYTKSLLAAAPSISSILAADQRAAS